jgi:hypothetical protein
MKKYQKKTHRVRLKVAAVVDDKNDDNEISTSAPA